MKKLLTVVFAVALVGPSIAFAHGGGDDDGGSSCPTCTTCPVGATGAAGINGTNGTNGTNGINGINGVNGAAGINGQDGKDAETHTKLIGGVDVRLLDYQHIAIHAFDDYNLRDGHNDSIGARVVVKLGQSWEERQMAIMQKQINDLRSVAHRPGIHQEHYYNEYTEPVYPEGKKASQPQ